MAGEIERVSDFSVHEMFVDNARFFNLSGRALPHRPISFGTKLNTSTKNYQGNPESQIQIMSSSSEKTQIKGRWSGRYMDGASAEIDYGDTVEYNDAADNSFGYVSVASKITDRKMSKDIIAAEETAMLDFCEWMEEFVATGPTISCVWMDRARKGVLLSFNYDVKDSRDIEWRMEFEWNSYKLHAARSKFKELKATEITKSWLDNLRDYRLMLEQALGLDPLSGMYGPNIPIVSDFFDILKDVNSTMLQINAAVAEVESMNNALVNGIMLPSQIARNAVAVMLNAFAAIERMEDIWKQNAIQEMSAWQYQYDSIGKPGWQDSLPNIGSSSYFDSKSFSDFGLGSQYKVPTQNGVVYGAPQYGKPVINYSTLAESLKPGLNNNSLPFDMRAILRVLKYNMQTSISQIKNIYEPSDDIKTVEISTENQHIGMLASKHYGVWSKWPALAEYNKINSPLLPAGKLVVIPWSLQS